ncbi:MAG: hypothetical protein JKY89_09285 [Immundisolibacteraceae bacterium]|nr:hypothetical protein [Immundisolibacteraceae bacterium]
MIHIMVALQAEAKPLVNQYRLKGLPPLAGFRRYGNDQITLLVTGVGSVAMAAGVMALGLAGDSLVKSGIGQTGWLNIGIAGHQCMPLASVVVAGKITDQSSGLCWYPPQILALELPVLPLLTVAKPVTDYPDSQLIDMEASGYFVTACRFSVGESAQVLKVVSDNRDSNIDQLNGPAISGLIENALDPIGRLIDKLQHQLSSVADSVVSSTEVDQFLQRFRLSKSQQFQLVRLLQDYRVLTGELAGVEQFDQLHRAADLLNALEQLLLPHRRNYQLGRPDSDLA